MQSIRRPQVPKLRTRRPTTSRFLRVGEAEARLSRMSARSERVSALTDRLEEALVFIIHNDGRREYETMTLRQLYNYVLQAIATRPEGYVQQSSHNLMVRRSGVQADIHEVIEEDGNEVDETENVEAQTRAADGEEAVSVDEIETKKKVTFDDKAKSSRRRSVKGGKPACITESVTYRERLGGYLHPRDMRRLVTPFSTSNAPELMVRRHVILMNCDPLRAIVLRDRLLVLVPDGADSILETLGHRIIGGREEMEDSVFGSRHGESVESNDSSHKSSSDHRADSDHHRTGRTHKFTHWPGRGKGKETKRTESTVSDATVEESDVSDTETIGDEWDDLEGRGWIDLPFELKAVDAVLHTVSIMLAEDVDTLQTAVYETVDEVLGKGRAGAGDHNQQLLRAFKNEINEMSSRVDNFVRAINEALDDLEDLSLMNLSRLLTHPERFIQPVPEEVLNEESDEPELILEVYLQQALSIHNQLDLLTGQVTTSEELMAMQLDTVRNRLLYINAVVSVFTLNVSLAALVGSIYGMNVINGREEDPNAFNNIVIGTSVGCFVFLCSLLFVFYRALSLPSMQ